MDTNLRYRQAVCAVVVLAMTIGATGCSKIFQGNAPPPPPPPAIVQVMEVTKTKVTRTASFIGRLDSPQNVEVRARVESFLDKILFKEGEEVKLGDPLFELDRKPYEQQLAAAKAKLAEANAALSKSKLDVERLTPLAAAGASPQRDLDNAKSATEANAAAVAAAEAQVKSAELNLSYCDIRSPIGGRIGAKEVPIGSLVGKGEPTLLATISEIDPIWFYCYLSEVDFLEADRLAKEAGRKMGELPATLILTDGTEHPQPGKWVFIDRVVDASTATIRARAEFPNPGKVLRPGMFARVRMNLPAKQDSIVVPERALTELQGKTFVWVLDAENKASQRMVEVESFRIGPDALIRKGLEPGERIVVEGIQKLREGAPAQPQTAEEIAKIGAAHVKELADKAHAHEGQKKPAKH